MEKIIKEEGKLIEWHLFDSITREVEIPPERLLYDWQRYLAYQKLKRKTIDAEDYTPDTDDDNTDRPWRVVYALHNCPVGSDSEDVDKADSDWVDFRFKTEEARTKFDEVVTGKESTYSDIELCVCSRYGIDIQLFNLCCLLSCQWLRNSSNAFLLAGYFYRYPHGVLEVSRRTYMAIYKQKCGKAFDYDLALSTFEKWGTKEYFPKFNEDAIKSIVKSIKPKEYEEWKRKCIGQDVAEEGPKKITTKEWKKALFKAVCAELYKLPKDLITTDGYYFRDLIMQEEWDDYKSLARVVKSSYAYVLNNNTVFLLIKTFVTERYGDNDSVRTITYEQEALMSRSAAASTQFLTVNFQGQEIEVNVRELLLGVFRGIEYDFANVLPYSPKMSRNVDDSTFNMFPIYQHTYDPDYVPNQEIVELFDTQVRRYLCNADERVGKYALDWFAFTLQKPHLKTGTSLLFKSKQGAGKNFTFNFIARYVLSPMMCAVVTDMNRLTGRFDNIGPGKKLVLVDEALDGNRANAQVFKNLITESRQPLERKGEQTIYVDDFRNYMVATNNDFSSVVEKSCRRFVCIECSDAVCPSQPGAHEYWENMAAKLLTVEAGRSIFHWLLQRDISDFNVRKIPNTKYKRELKLRMANPAVRFLLHKYDKWLEEEKTDEEEVSHDDLFKEYKAWSEECMPSSKTISDYRFGSMLNERGLTLGKPKAVPWSNKKMKFRTLSVAILAEALKSYIAGEEEITD